MQWEKGLGMFRFRLPWRIWRRICILQRSRLYQKYLYKFLDTHCVDTGIACFLFDDTGYHSAAWLVNHTNSHQGIDCDDAEMPSCLIRHRAMVAFNDLLNRVFKVLQNTMEIPTGLVEVCGPVYTIIACYDLGAKYSKHQYSTSNGG